MHLNIKSTGFELTPDIKEYINKKIGLLGKFISDYHKEALKIDVEIGRTTFHHQHGNVYKARAHFIMPRRNIFALQEAEDVFAAIDLLEAKLKTELIKTRAQKRDILIDAMRQLKKMMRLPKFWKRGKK